MVTNDDVVYNGKFICSEQGGFEKIRTYFSYKGNTYVIHGTYDDAGNFHAFWGDDSAEKIEKLPSFKE